MGRLYTTTIERCYFMKHGSQRCYSGYYRLIYKGESYYSSLSREKDLLQKSIKIDRKTRFLPKMRLKNHNFRVRGVIVPSLPGHFRVRGVVAVILVKMTFCKIIYFRYAKNFFGQITKTPSRP